ncbi:MAG TPA: hypothetical protein VMT03_21210 [Polyangia bacterium]|nr:hypothetical protein [Polyangia bacterium]
MLRAGDVTFVRQPGWTGGYWVDGQCRIGLMAGDVTTWYVPSPGGWEIVRISRSSITQFQLLEAARLFDR